MKAIYKKELKGLFNNMTGYVFICFILLMLGIYCTALNLNSGYANFEYVLDSMSFIFLIVVPILTMRIFSEEKHQKTDQLLYALPLKVPSIVLGKYFAMLTVFAIPTGIMCLYPPILSLYGNVPMKSAYGAIVGVVFLGAALIAVGMFVSSLTESQIIACVVSFGTLLFSYLMTALISLLPATASASAVAFLLVFIAAALIVYAVTKNCFISAILACGGAAAIAAIYFIDSSKLENAFPTVLGGLAIFDKFYNFIYGIFDITAIVYFLTVALIFIFLCMQSVEKRRWS